MLTEPYLWSLLTRGAMVQLGGVGSIHPRIFSGPHVLCRVSFKSHIWSSTHLPMIENYQK